MSKLLGKLLTRSFPGKREEPSGPAIIEGPIVSDGSYESLAFNLWNEEIQRRNAVKVLDLGRVRAANLNFFMDRGVDLGIVNLIPEEGIDQLERFSTSGPYQGALLWDLPNYFGTDDLKSMGQWLADQLTTNAPVFLTLATKTPFRELPASYEILGEDTLRIESDHAYLARTELCSGTRLGKLWPQFENVRSFLLRNGMQEFLFRRT
ncbi:MAG: hypothetical protein R3200_01420 [Xanthomonadales bacterium]|nr:hypothetical protein [Xanthomonadales bacterium]